MKDTLIEIKKNRETIVEWMKLRMKSMIWDIRKQKQPIRTRRRKKNPKKQGQYKEPLGQLQAFHHLYHRVPEGEEKEQETGNLFEKIMKQNFPNLVKEIGIQVQEAQSVPNKMDAKRPTQDTS